MANEFCFDRFERTERWNTRSNWSLRMIVWVSFQCIFNTHVDTDGVVSLTVWITDYTYKQDVYRKTKILESNIQDVLNFPFNPQYSIFSHLIIFDSYWLYEVYFIQCLNCKTVNYGWLSATSFLLFLNFYFINLQWYTLTSADIFREFIDWGKRKFLLSSKHVSSECNEFESILLMKSYFSRNSEMNSIFNITKRERCE